MDQKAKFAVGGIDQALIDLDDYCATQCQVPSACEGCPIRHAKRCLATQRLVEFIPELGEKLTPSQQVGLKDAERNPFTVIDGGKK